MPWPEDWDALVSGATCPMCEQGRPEETKFGARVLTGTYCDAYLAKSGAQRGYVFVVWRGRHVVEPIDLTAEELAGYWAEVVAVAGAARKCFGARKVNYETLGNTIPHLHTHVTMRFAEGDVNPGAPLPKDRDVPVDPGQFAADLAALRGALSPGTETTENARNRGG